MVEAGVLRERERVELIDGELIVPPIEGPFHANLMTKIRNRLVQAYPLDRFVIRENHPLVLSDASEPQPDLVVVPGTETTFDTRHPSGAETTLVIEIALSSLKLDRAMIEDFARSGVPVYWIVDVSARTIEQHSVPNPQLGTYQDELRSAVQRFPGTQTDLDLVELLP